MPKARDLDFEALVKTTNANVAMERGRLNTALAAIKVAWQSEGGRPEDLAQEIILRGDAYREVWPKMTITPTALAVHWHRVMAELAQRSKTPQLRAIEELRKETNADD